MSEVKEFDIKWTMVVDLDKYGCGACMVACQAENNVAPNPDGTNKVRSINWMKVYRLSNHKPFPGTRHGLPAPPLYAVREALLRVRLPRRRHRQERGRHRQPDSIPAASAAGTAWPHALTMPVISTGMIRSGRKAWKDPHPGRFRASPRRGGKMHLLPSPLDEGQGQGHRRGTQPYELADGEYVTSCTEVCPNGAIPSAIPRIPNTRCTS